MDSGGTGKVASTANMDPSEFEILEPQEEFDAFNDDTFGNAAEAWMEEDHAQLVGSHVNEGDACADFFDLSGQDGTDDDDLLGGALEPEGQETVEANGGRPSYLLEEELHPDDLNQDGTLEYGNENILESNGHELSSNFVEQLNLKQQDVNAMQPKSLEAQSDETCKHSGPPQVQDPAILSVLQGTHLISQHEMASVPQAAVVQGAPHLQTATAFPSPPVTACPQHPHHHHGPHQHIQHQQLIGPSIQMAVPAVPQMGTQCNSAMTQQQQPTVIFAAPPPGHHPMSIPVIAGFPHTATMQVHSAAHSGMHHGHPTSSPLFGHTQAIHIHHHPSQPVSPHPHVPVPNVQGFPPTLPPPHAQSTSSKDLVTARGPINHQQEFQDPAIMSVGKLPPPILQPQDATPKTLTPNMMQTNSRQFELYGQNPRPPIPPSSKVKSVQDLEREMMRGPFSNLANSGQNVNKNYYSRSQGHLQNRGPYNGNNATRSIQPGFRNQIIQQYGNAGIKNFNQRYSNHQGNYNRFSSSSGTGNSFDDKNRDTFGEDFVLDHQQQQQARQQRYNYGEREHSRGGNNLITPGHVHVLGILRGAREKQGKGVAAEPTGNPQLDLQHQRQQESNIPNAMHENRRHDEFGGLMTPRERQWIVNIQLTQLKCENPFLDDYYYTVFNQKKDLAEAADKAEKDAAANDGSISTTNSTKEATPQSTSNQRRQRLEATLSISSEDGLMPGDVGTQRTQVKRNEEGAQLLLPAESKVGDGSSGVGNNAGNEGYTPKQFTNSLGCLQAVTVKAPRKIIDVGVILNEGQEQMTLTSTITNSTTQKDTKNFKKTLIELERLYSLLIEVEDCEKKLTALPTGTAMRMQVEGERIEALVKIRSGPLSDAARLKKYMMVRKGKALLVRALRLLDEENIKVVCNTLFSLYSLAVKKDRDDQLLGLLWDAGLARHLNSNAVSVSSDFDTLYAYLRMICTGTPGLLGATTGSRGSSKSPPPETAAKPGNAVPLTNVKLALSTPLGVAVVATCVHRLGLLLQNGTPLTQNEDELKLWFYQLGSEVAECKEIVKPVGVGLCIEESIVLPHILSSSEKKSFDKLVAAIEKVV